ncbi:hypothetical protein PBRA_001872 [Plasmodiophora brassicae]|uniref:Atg6 BARA domain-containing protein n=1 Tax=Plasmodiophora brassicae TaxID=37360 RepID=A0A0G4J1V8_PLABS|nr:hypothetical protein PBRA_001872 [Plasmodiophora brassicae]
MECQSCGAQIELSLGRAQTTTTTTVLQRDANTDEDVQLDDALTESFVMLDRHVGDEEAPVDPTSNAELFQAMTRIWEVASEQASCDMPLCTVCVANVFREQNRKIQELEAERAAYKQVLDSLETLTQQDVNQQHSSSEEPLRKVCWASSDSRSALVLNSTLQIDRQEDELLQQLRDMQKLKLDLTEKARELDDQTARVSELEKAFWTAQRQLTSSAMRAQFEEAALAEVARRAEHELEELKRTNIYDDAFHIYYEGHFGTINGFRLGRLPSQPVDWSETNAALGQAVLLLDTIAKRTRGFEFSKSVRAHTKRQLLANGYQGRENDLGTVITDQFIDIAMGLTFSVRYGSNDLSLGKLWWYRRFDSAMVKFATCVKEYCLFAEAQSGHKVMQYQIDDHMINGVSVKLQFNQEAKWTKAMKFLLINLKFAVAWCVKQEHAE